MFWRTGKRIEEFGKVSEQQGCQISTTEQKIFQCTLYFVHNVGSNQLRNLLLISITMFISMRVTNKSFSNTCS